MVAGEENEDNCLRKKRCEQSLEAGGVSENLMEFALDLSHLQRNDVALAAPLRSFSLRGAGVLVQLSSAPWARGALLFAVDHKLPRA
jgi:hypothetical protein